MAEASQSQPPSVEEKIEQARQYKKDGNDKFKSKEYKSAIGKYHRALLYVKGLVDSQVPMLSIIGGGKAESISDDIKAEAQTLKMDCLNNLAACLLQNHPPNYEKVVQYCDEILSSNPANVKAMYRKGVALYNLRNFDGALEVLQQAQVQPQGAKDPNVRKYLALCEKERAKQDEKLKMTYKNMFDKMAMGDDEHVAGLKSTQELQQNGKEVSS